MRKTMFTVVFILSFLILFNRVYAFESFVPSLSNPLSLSSQYTNWNEIGVLQGQVVMENNSSYSLWYSSLGNGIRIAKASSTDGLSWSRNTLYSFLGNQDTSDPYFVKNDPNYLYFATTPAGSTTRIMRITQINEVFNNSTMQEVLIPEKRWGLNGTTSPVVWYEGSTYYLFYSALESRWDMGMATSQDGITFNECNNNPFLSGDTVPRSIIKYDNEYYLFFHSPQGLGYVKTPILACNTVWSARVLVGLSGYFPSIIRTSDAFRLYYGSPIGGVWKLYLATSSLPTPIPPTPSPTPTNQPKHPIIIIPGLFGSWNKEAIVHEESVNQLDWKLNPIVKEYEGIEKTLQNLSYEKNKDYFIFAYDWRKNIENTASYLNTFITNLHLLNPPDIIGHSLGGLVGRIYAQKYPTTINKLVTVGSPHKGVAQVYKALEAGEIETDNTSLWLTQQLILQLYRDGIKTNQQVLAEKLPVLFNLFPTIDFLKQNNIPISIENMKIKNNLLAQYSDFPNSLYSLIGDKGNTLSGYEVKSRTNLDKLLDTYPDGRPEKQLFKTGDFTVTMESAGIGNNISTLQKDHGELIYSKEGIKKILDILNITYKEENIMEGKGTIITPSLFFLMMSPAQLQVTFGDKTYEENDGILFIENAQTGSYIVSAKGKEKGRYTILIGQMGANKDQWNKIEGEITQDPPSSQTDTYSIAFNDQTPQFPLALSSNLFDELILYLTDLNKIAPKNDLIKAISNVSQGKQYSSNKGKLKSYLSLAHQQLFLTYKKTDINVKSKILYGIEKLENMYGILLDGYNSGLIPSRLKQEIADLKKQVSPLQSYLLLMKNSGKAVQKNVLQLMEIEKRLNLSEEAINQKRYPVAEIYLKSSQEMMKEVRII